MTESQPLRYPPAPRREYWLYQLVGWGLYVILTLYQLRHDGMPLARGLVETLVASAVGITLTTGFRKVALRRGWLRRRTSLLALRVIGASVGVAVFHVAILTVLELGIYGDRPTSPGLMILGAVIRWTMVFFIWMALYFGFVLLQDRKQAELHRLQLEMDLRTTELRSLKSQLNPHFLFNSLNSIRALITEDPEQAKIAVTRLARMLRRALGTEKDDLVTLERELEIAEDYLGLEYLRLGDRLKIERSISSTANEAQIPFMLLQTLVENAIKHGIAHLPQGGTLRISADRENGVLTLEVTNPRPTGEVPPPDLSGGVGLVNARERLRLLFGTTATLDLDLTVTNHATIRVRVPQRT